MSGSIPLPGNWLSDFEREHRSEEIGKSERTPRR